MSWKIEINPFGKSSDDKDNIFIIDEDGYTVAVISKHPVWNYLEQQRMERARIIATCPEFVELYEIVKSGNNDTQDIMTQIKNKLAGVT